MITENLSTLKIHKLSQEQYNRELDAGRIDMNALYLTPDTSIFVQNYEPTDAIEGSLWVDMDATSTGSGGCSGSGGLTNADLEEIKSYIDNTILGGEW